jgi:hypothetical protein
VGSLNALVIVPAIVCSAIDQVGPNQDNPKKGNSHNLDDCRESITQSRSLHSAILGHLSPAMAWSATCWGKPIKVENRIADVSGTLPSPRTEEIASNQLAGYGSVACLLAAGHFFQ